MPAPKASSGAASTADSATLPLTLPASIAAGDLILVRWSTNTGSPTTITINGSGYTVGEDNTASGAVASKMWWKVATAADAGSTVTATYAATSRLSAVCVVMAAGDFDPNNPLNAVTGLSGQPGPTVTQPAVTTTVDNCTILFWDVQQSAGTPSFTPPSGFTNVILSATAKPSGKNNSEAVAWGPSGTAGTYGPWTATYLQGGGDGGTHTIALAPTASVVNPSTGTASTSWVAAASATGSAPAVPVSSGTATASWAAASSAIGQAPPVPVAQGSASATWTATTSATGQAPVITVATGTAATSWAAVSTATGSAPAIGGASGTAATSWTGLASATGTAPTVPASTGAALTSWTAATTATGKAPTVGGATGTATTSWVAAATARGRAPVVGGRDLKILSTSVPTTGWDANGPVTAWTTETPATTDWPTTSPAAAWATSTPEH